MAVPEQVVISIVARALERLIERDSALLERDVNEQTVAHHLARYIHEGFAGEFSVDVEYNRHLNEKKVVLMGERWAVVRPDIVVHERGTDRCNVLVVEVKKFGAELAHDREKLLALIGQYGYQHAAHVLVGRRTGKAAAEVIWLQAATGN